jgi:hypothetical protein
MKENMYPFEMPFPQKPLPKLRADGTVYLDVKFRDKWDGVLVVTADRRCVGVRLGGQVSYLGSAAISSSPSSSGWSRKL